MHEQNHHLLLGYGESGLASFELLQSLGHTKITFSADQTPKGSLPAPFIEARELLKNPAIWAQHKALIHSPGFPLDHPLIEKARQDKLIIRSEIDLCASLMKGPIWGITGTNGKSTVTSMLSYALNRLGLKSFPLGNFGTSPARKLAQNDIPSQWLLELSSYQLEGSFQLKLDIGLWTSLSPDHLSRHKTFSNYIKAKWKLVEAIRPGGYLIWPKSLRLSLENFGLRPPSHIRTLELDDLDSPPSNYPYLRENHYYHSHHHKALYWDEPHFAKAPYPLNLSLCSLALCHFLAIDPHQAQASLRGFQPLAYRSQLLGFIGPYPIINDSKATNVASTTMALKGMTEPCLLLLGGVLKGESLLPILDHQAKIKEILAFGAGAPVINQELGPHLNVKVYPSLTLLMSELKERLTRRPLPVLFSPAGASFDEFIDYNARGQFFNHSLIHLLKKEPIS